jgi:hypothetical protein
VRIAVTLLAACVGLAACTGSRDVSSSPPPIASYKPPPTISYKVTGNNVSQANVKAENYCLRALGTLSGASAGSVRQCCCL